MPRRTTIELDEDLLGRAQQALGAPTMRATIEEALRRVVEHADGERTERAERQRRYLSQLHRRTDVEVLASDEMWK